MQFGGLQYGCQLPASIPELACLAAFVLLLLLFQQLTVCMLPVLCKPVCQLAKCNVPAVRCAWGVRLWFDLEAECLACPLVLGLTATGASRLES